MHLNRQNYIIIVFKKIEKPVINIRKFVIKIEKIKISLELK